MPKFIYTLNSMIRNERGASAVEYGLLVAAIAAVIVAAVFLLGGQVNGKFTCVNDSMVAKSGQCP